MAPIHDTDLAEQRWSKAEWEHFELWEKIEIRLKRRKWYWILGAAVVFLIFSSVPIIIDRTPKWRTLAMSRELAQEIGFIKRESSIQHEAYRLRFKADNLLTYIVEKAASCADKNWIPVREGSVVKASTAIDQARDYSMVTPDAGTALGVPGLVSEFCYDHMTGSTSAVSGQDLVGFAFAYVKDLTDHRTDRLSIVLLKGRSAEISFD